MSEKDETTRDQIADKQDGPGGGFGWRPDPTPITAIPPFFSEHWYDSDGHPEGGTSWGSGFCISWQHGPLKRRRVPRVQPNGAFIESVLGAIIDRLEHYQLSEFQCDENAEALKHLRMAADALQRRINRRAQEGTLGSHKGA